MINPISIRYNLTPAGIRLRPDHGKARNALEARGVEFGLDGWALLSEEAGRELQAFAGAATTLDRQPLVARADLERWLHRAAPAERPQPLPLVAMDWLALANGIEDLSPNSDMEDRPAIVAILVGLGMSERANPRVVAWAGLAGENAP